MQGHLQHWDGVSQTPRPHTGGGLQSKGNLIRWLQRRQGAIIINAALEAKFLSWLWWVGAGWELSQVEGGLPSSVAVPGEGRRESLHEAPQN